MAEETADKSVDLLGTWKDSMKAAMKVVKTAALTDDVMVCEKVVL